MTIDISDNSPRVSYSVSEGATQTSFTVSFEFFDNEDLNVYVDGVLKTLTSDYTVTGGDGSTGTVSMSVTGGVGGSTVVITRDIALERTTDFPISGPFNITTLNTELDRLVAIAADLEDQASRALQLTDYDVAVSLTLPEVANRKGKVLAFNETTGAVESGPSIADVQSVSLASADIAKLADIEDGTEATDTIKTVAGISSNVTTVAGISSNVTTVAGNIAAINTNADNITDIQNASANASAAATSATNAAASETAAAASETAAGLSETAAAASKTAAAASETAAAASESAAATSATNAATSETNAASSASAASTSATTATTQATSASSSATSAASSATSALSSKADAESARDQAQSARDTANLHKIAAETAATSATTTAAALTGFDLEAIAASKAVTAVDVFVYDTSKDSDGGAWRKRTQHTSWYNEALNTATRGARREFPAVAVIVAEASKVTIYDGDDPALPMWMVLNQTNAGPVELWRLGRNATSLAGFNGSVCIGTSLDDNAGLLVLDFVADRTSRRSALSNYGFGIILNRNSGATLPVASADPIVSANVNDAAMTVLPDAPIDSATGLPVPTIAVATAGGVSVIKDDGTVNNVPFGPYYGTAANHISFADDNSIVFHRGGSSGQWFPYYLSNPDDTTIASMAFPKIPSGELFRGKMIVAGNSVAEVKNSWVDNYRLMLAEFFDKDYQTAIQADITSTYNTGWMNGDIKGAFLADTDDTDLVAGANDQSRFAGGLVDTTKYVRTSGLGVQKKLKFTIGSDVSPTNRLRVYETSNQFSNYYDTAGTYEIVYNVLAQTRMSSVDGSPYVTVSDVTLTDVEQDRSVNANGLIVNGTVTRSPVATGAELVAYSGFSPSNYLEQPYNSALDFGTGDFCVMGWITPSAASDWLVDRMEGRNGSSNLTGFMVWQLTASPQFSVYQNNSNTNVTATTVMTSGVWYFFTAVRRNGVLEMYMQGNLEATTSGTARNTSYTSTGNPPPLTIGAKNGGGSSWLSGKAALIRISATAPTAEQIKKIYEDEKVLFQENAACTLYGTSDAVTALAHDSDTGLLHVGTSAGRSVFQGLRRASNTTTAVGTAISASNGLVVEE